MIQKISEHYQQLLGFSPKRTKLRYLTKREWGSFCKHFNLDGESEGIFLPRNLTAYVLGDSENFYLNMFHEYFGHGLFYEYSKKGKFIERLEKKLMKEERNIFKKERFSIEDLQNFREKNPTFILLEKERQKNIGLYESFAVWTEKYLSGIFNMEEKFSKKYKEMPKELQENIEKLSNFEKEFGELALFYELGMPKYYDSNKIKYLLKNVLKERFNSVELIILYGSRKPYSDIDLFIVSPELDNFSNNWIDIYVMNRQEFEHAVSMFDVSIIGPLFKGKIISGNEGYPKQKRKQLIYQPVTKESIEHNLNKSKEQKTLAFTFPENSKERRVGLAYSETYLRNAIDLKSSIRALNL